MRRHPKILILLVARPAGGKGRGKGKDGSGTKGGAKPDKG
jgi:hypothetical protein